MAFLDLLLSIPSPGRWEVQEQLLLPSLGCRWEQGAVLQP